MSISTYVPALLAACWVLPAVVIFVLHAIRSRTTPESGPVEMEHSHRGIRADILQVDYDARKKDWRSENWEGVEAQVRSRVVDRSHEVMMIAPYAEASVTVHDDAGQLEKRRCTLCLN